MLVYALSLPAANAPDVVKREVTEVVDGGAPRVFEATDGQEVKYVQDSAVKLSLVDIDDAGNRSEPSGVFEFTATDTIPPPQAGQVGVTIVREEP